MYSVSGIKVMIGWGGGCLIGLRLGIMVSSMGRGEVWVGGGGWIVWEEEGCMNVKSFFLKVIWCYGLWFIEKWGLVLIFLYGKDLMGL